MTPALLIAAGALSCMLAIALAIALGVALLLSLCAACGAAAAWAWTPVAARRYERVLRARYEPLPPSQTSGRRHVRPQLDPCAVDADVYWTAARESSAVAELPQTLPMPVEALAAAFDWELAATKSP